MADWYPKMFGLTDADIFMEIFHVLETTAIESQFHHVCGHQDVGHHDLTSLSRKAQLNIGADRLATVARCEQDPVRPPSFRPLPLCPLYLVWNGTFVTGQEHRHLRKELPRLDAEVYFLHCYHWSTSIINDCVDWMAFTAARLKTQQLHVNTTKLIAGWLPTNRRLARENPGFSASCPFCGQEETQDHLFLCFQRKDWRKQFYRDLQHFLVQAHTCPKLQRHIIHGLRHVTLARTPASHYDHVQHTIGWHLAFRGFISQQWGRQQRDFRLRQPTPTHVPCCYKPTAWEANLITFLWKQMHKLWVDRCQYAHRLATRHHSTQTCACAEATVRVLYEHADHVGAHDQALFPQPLQQRFDTSSTADLFAWATTTEAAILQARKAHTHRFTRHVRDIRHYFPPTSIQPTRSRPHAKGNVTRGMTVTEGDHRG